MTVLLIGLVLRVGGAVDRLTQGVLESELSRVHVVSQLSTRCRSGIDPSPVIPCAATHPELIAQAQTFLALAIGASTRQTYSSGLRSFISFVDTHGIQPAFPASVETLSLWMTSLASPPRPVTLGTCKVYLSAVVTRHTELGFDHPLDKAPPMLSRILAGIKRMSAQPSQPKLPITTALLEEMRPHLNLQHHSDILLWAMMWTATTGLLRISEFATRGDHDTSRLLTMQQLTLHDQGQRPYSLWDAVYADEETQYAIFRLTASKSDPSALGSTSSCQRLPRCKHSSHTERTCSPTSPRPPLSSISPTAPPRHALG